MALHDEFENVPYHRLTFVDNLLGRLDGLDDAAFDEFADDKGLIEFGCHKFGQTAFVHFEFRTDNNNRTCRVVDTLSE